MIAGDPTLKRARLRRTSGTVVLTIGLTAIIVGVVLVSLWVALLTVPLLLFVRWGWSPARWGLEMGDLERLRATDRPRSNLMRGAFMLFVAFGLAVLAWNLMSR